MNDKCPECTCVEGTHHSWCSRKAKPPVAGAAPCSVERNNRSVIEHKLLTALEDDNTVAALLSKQDLEVLIAALDDKRLTGEAELHRRRSLIDGMSQLLREAFPPNAPGEPQPT